MFALTVRGVVARKTRGVLTALAVFFGVAMIAGTLMLTDSVNNSFDNIFSESNSGVDVSIKTKETIEDSRGAPPPAFDAGVLEQVQAVDGVADAAGGIFDPTVSVLDEQGERVGIVGPPHFAVSVVPDRFSPWNYSEGRPPESADEMAIDNFTAEREGWTVGDTARVAGTGTTKTYEISGIARWGSGVELLGASLAILTLPEAQRLTGKQAKFDEIAVAAEEGVSPEELKLAVQRAVPASLEALTGEENAAEESQGFKEGFGIISNASARLRRHRPVRRRLHHLQHVLDHRRPAHAGVRDASDARRSSSPGARCGAARGGDRRARRVGARNPRRDRVRRRHHRLVQGVRVGNSLERARHLSRTPS